MAGSVNKVILVGNLGADPEIRRLNSGDPVVNLRIATSESWRDKNSGERKEKTEWHQRRHLQRQSRQGRRAVSEEGHEGLYRGRSCRPANGKRTASSAIRRRSCCRNSAASCRCWIRAGRAAKAARSAIPAAARGSDFGQSSPSEGYNSGGGGGGSRGGGGASRELDDEIPF